MLRLVAVEAVAAVLIVAAAGKAVHAGAMAAILGEASIPPRFYRHVELGLAVCELAVAASLILWPYSLISWGIALSMFSGFALLGGWALLTGKRIECGCFGRAVSHNLLGWSQLTLLGLVLVAYLASLGGSRNHSGFAPLVLLPATLVAVAGYFLLRSVASWRVVRGQLKSLGPAGSAPVDT